MVQQTDGDKFLVCNKSVSLKWLLSHDISTDHVSIRHMYYLNERNLDKMLRQSSHEEFQIATQNNMKPLNSLFRARLMPFLFFHSQKGSIGTRLKWRCILQSCKPAHIIPTNQACDTGMQAQLGSHHNKYHFIW